MGTEVTQRPEVHVTERTGRADHGAELTCQQLRKDMPEKDQFCIFSLCPGPRWLVRCVAWTGDIKGPGASCCPGCVSRSGAARGLSGV